MGCYTEGGGGARASNHITIIILPIQYIRLYILCNKLTSGLSELINYIIYCYYHIDIVAIFVV